MPRRDVQFSPGEYYHLYNRGNNRQTIFFERENYGFFLQRVREYLLPGGITVVAYCLMPNHYHLLVGINRGETSEVSKTSEVSPSGVSPSETSEVSGVSHNVSTAMMRLSVSFTKAINERYDRVGALFQGPFQAVHVDRNEYLLHLSRYIHLNPVAAGLVEQPEAWEFSSYREYIGLRHGTLPAPDIVLSQFQTRSAYQTFVASYIERDRDIIAHLLLDD